MFLKHVPTGDLVEVIDLPDVINPNSPTIRARSHTGEIIQRPKNFLKTELVFPSGETLPLCWRDVHYYKHEHAA
ncbi:acetyltransferase [Verrucomicrobia bacterium S94]|nr:acetyltransferase [Verrucomicrobia bacterium S94]